MQKNDINTIPIQQFINLVKSADSSNQREVKIPIETAKKLAFTLGETMAKLNGELESLLLKKQESESVVQVNMDGGNNW
jgi:hypothetical protein